MTERAQDSSRKWDGALTVQGMNGELIRQRNEIARAVAVNDWVATLPILTENQELVNAALRKGRSWSTLLHWATAIDAPKEFVLELTRLGAFRTVCDPAGKRAVDIVADKRRSTLIGILEPELQLCVCPEYLLCMQELFHGLVRAAMIRYHVTVPLRLPQLSILTETRGNHIWFPVPGMAGGFSFWLEKQENSYVLISESWSRIWAGSMRHRITPVEVILLECDFC